MNEQRQPDVPSDPHASQNDDPQSGQSDDPRVDPTPARRHTKTPPGGGEPNALGIAEPTA